MQPSFMSLSWLISPIGGADFFEQHWEKEPLIVRRHSPSYYDDLLSLSEFDKVLNNSPPNISYVLADGRRVRLEPRDGFSGWDVHRAIEHYAEGATLVLDALDRCLPSLHNFCRKLEGELGCLCWTNVYLTPPKAQGFKAHFDKHDVMILQIHGVKRWRLGKAAIELPLPGEQYEHQAELGDGADEFDLGPGDLIYIPRGFVHEARSQAEGSLHITLGIQPYTWSDLLSAVFVRAKNEQLRLRQSLPVPFWAGTSCDRLGEQLRSIVRDALSDEIVSSAVRDFVSEKRKPQPQSAGRVVELTTLATLNENSWLIPRYPSPSIVKDGDTLIVSVDNASVEFPAYTEKTVRQLIESGRINIKALTDTDLDLKEKIAIARRLVKVGILAVYK